jgi:hypothetical protein
MDRLRQDMTIFDTYEMAENGLDTTLQKKRYKRLDGDWRA